MSADTETAPRTQASDIPAGGWVDRYVPRGLRPYIRPARLDRPIGTWLLLFPCWWSTGMAWRGWEDAWLFAAFGIGPLAMRGARCTSTDLRARDLAAQVAPTRHPPPPTRPAA